MAELPETQVIMAIVVMLEQMAPQVLLEQQEMLVILELLVIGVLPETQVLVVMLVILELLVMQVSLLEAAAEAAEVAAELGRTT